MKKTPALYNQRIEKKIEIEFSDCEKKDAKVGEFWRYREGMNIGNEISKDENFKRPCLILQNTMGNGLLLVCPITTKFHNWMDKYCIDIRECQKYGLKLSRLILNQTKLIDSRRLVGKLSEIKIRN